MVISFCFPPFCFVLDYICNGLLWALIITTRSRYMFINKRLTQKNVDHVPSRESGGHGWGGKEPRKKSHFGPGTRKSNKTQLAIKFFVMNLALTSLPERAGKQGGEGVTWVCSCVCVCPVISAGIETIREKKKTDPSSSSRGDTLIYLYLYSISSIMQTKKQWL